MFSRSFTFVSSLLRFGAFSFGYVCYVPFAFVYVRSPVLVTFGFPTFVLFTLFVCFAFVRLHVHSLIFVCWFTFVRLFVVCVLVPTFVHYVVRFIRWCSLFVGVPVTFTFTFPFYVYHWCDGYDFASLFIRFTTYRYFSTYVWCSFIRFVHFVVTISRSVDIFYDRYILALRLFLRSTFDPFVVTLLLFVCSFVC